MMANANCPQILPYTQEIRSKNLSHQWSYKVKKLYKNLFAPGLCAALTPLGELTELPRPTSWWGGGSQSLPRTPPHPTAAFWASAHHLPSPGKSPAGAHVYRECQ